MAKTTLMTQVSLRTADNQVMTTWLPKDDRLKESGVISLKNDDRKWTITNVYQTMDQSEIMESRHFDNNNYDHHKGLGI